MRRSILVLAIVSTVAFSETAVFADVSFQGLGDVPGGGFRSQTFGISADGSVVVGRSESSSGYKAFRWTSDGGMVGLGDLLGGGFYSQAWCISRWLSCRGNKLLDFGDRGISLDLGRWNGGLG